MEQALKQLCERCREGGEGRPGDRCAFRPHQHRRTWTSRRPPIPTLLAVGAVHHHLIRCALTTLQAAGLPFASASGNPHWDQPFPLAISQELLAICIFYREEACVDSLQCSDSLARKDDVVFPSKHEVSSYAQQH